MKNNTSKNQLWKVLGTSFGIAVTLGGTIGTGILRKPGYIATQVGNPTIVLILWLAVAIYAILGVSCVLELSLSVPRAGAWYVYAEKAFGRFIGFLVGISSWLGTVSALGFGAYTFSEYLGLIFPYLNNYLNVIAILTLVALWGFHQLGVKSAGKSQEWLSGLKAFALLLFVGICFGLGTGEGLAPRNSVPSVSISGILAALLSIFYAFDGWHTAAYFTEENANPEKSMPKSMYIGVVSVAGIYLLINIGILYVLPFNQLMGSKLAASDAIQYVLGATVGRWVTIFLMLSIFGILNTQVMFAPRVIYSMSKDALFFKSASYVNKGGTPTIATHLTIGMSCIFLLIGQSMSDSLSDIATFFFVFSYLAGFASLLGLRKKEPHLNRPYKVLWYPYLPWLMVIISLLFLIGTLLENSKNIGYLLGFISLCYLIYQIFLSKKNPIDL
ncbi:MAG: hypothetical protein RJA76_416 [Bacteroidota bacterium]|jgi:APA family basic amino acid/polyamine antiporter